MVALHHANLLVEVLVQVTVQQVVLVAVKQFAVDV